MQFDYFRTSDVLHQQLQYLLRFQFCLKTSTIGYLKFQHCETIEGFVNLCSFMIVDEIGVSQLHYSVTDELNTSNLIILKATSNYFLIYLIAQN